MRIFALENISQINGQQKFDKLIVNGVSLIDLFADTLEDTYTTEFDSIMKYMECVANMQPLPETKFRKLKTSNNSKVAEYEFKTKHLRVYAIAQPGGKIVVMGGYKTNQKADIKSFRSLKKEYLDSIKP